MNEKIESIIKKLEKEMGWDKPNTDPLGKFVGWHENGTVIYQVDTPINQFIDQCAKFSLETYFIVANSEGYAKSGSYVSPNGTVKMFPCDYEDKTLLVIQGTKTEYLEELGKENTFEKSMMIGILSTMDLAEFSKEDFKPYS